MWILGNRLWGGWRWLRIVFNGGDCS